MKTILNLTGVKQLKTEQLKSITGKEAAFCVCDGPRVGNPGLNTICVNCVEGGLD